MKMINIEPLKVFMDAAEDAHNQYLNQPKLLGDKPLTGEELEDYNRQSSELLESYNVPVELYLQPFRSWQKGVLNGHSTRVPGSGGKS